MPWHELRIEALDPLIVDSRPGVSNEHETLEYIPATRLRGALFESMRIWGHGLTPDEVFGDRTLRWSPAWPCGPEGNAWMPRPKCLNPPPHKAPLPSWCEWTGSELAAHRVKTEMNMSVGRHYGRRAQREGMLYAREAISPGQSFLSRIELPKEIEKTFETGIGTRRSANGACRIEIFPLPEDSRDFWSGDVFGQGARRTAGAGIGANGSTVTAIIQFTADAIVPGPAGGYYRGLDSAAWTELAGLPVTVRHAVSGARVDNGWSGPWGLPKGASLAIEKGSVFWLQAEDARFTQFLEEVKNKGVGIRGHEGFGWAILNPPWVELDEMASVLHASFEPTLSPTAIRPAGEGLPGYRFLTLSGAEPILARALLDAGKFRGNSGLSAKLNDAVQWARRQGVNWVVSYLGKEDSTLLDLLRPAELRTRFGEGQDDATSEAWLFYWNALCTEARWRERE